MRWSQIWQCIKGYRFDKVITLATEKNIKGGWEGWLQVELAMHLFLMGGSFEIAREEKYINSERRSDFYISYKGKKDPTYIELKCINPWNGVGAQNSVLTQYAEDIGKARAEQSVPIGCMLVYAVNDENELETVRASIAGQAGLFLREVYAVKIGTNENAGTRVFKDVYILYCEPKKNSYYFN